MIVSDLPYRWPWYEWLLSRASAVDAVFIAGDFLDLFCSDPPLSMQAARVASWLLRLSRMKRVAFCSGNHDGHLVLPGPVLPGSPNAVPDGRTDVVVDYVITCAPYWVDEGVNEKLMDRGRAYRKGKTWIVLHHVPPSLRSELNGEEVAALKLIHHYQPDYFLAWHLHEFPVITGSWRHQLGPTTVLVPGQCLQNRVPNHVIFDFRSGSMLDGQCSYAP